MSYLLNDPEFAETWKIFNEYLLEDYTIVLTDDKKNDRLNKLESFSKGDVKMANEILEIMIARGETDIFMPESNEFI